ncbi:MAG: hypothetical protein LBE36_03675 [Flavobacteriaceae bacterium]|jgi:hypothetical protein|nr:hypothetical protein [Flavobacteriaceae bacterium]
MEAIIVTVNNKTELSLLKSFLKLTKLEFHIEKREEGKVKFTQEEYWEKIEKSMSGKKYPVTEEFKKSLILS